MTIQAHLIGISSRRAGSNVRPSTKATPRQADNSLRVMSKVPLILATILLSLGGFAAVPPPDKLLPSDTFLVFTVPNWSATLKASGPMFQLWNDSAMKPFKEKFVTKFKTDAIEPFEREFGIKFSDYAGLAQGQVTLAFVQPTDDESKGL